MVLGSDGDFTYEGLIARYNSDLANNLGNLLARVATVVASKCGGIGPPPRSAAPGVRLSEVADGGRGGLAGGLGSASPVTTPSRRPGGSSVRPTRELEAAEPWKMPPGESVDAVLGDALEALRIVAVLVSPVMPATAGELWRRSGLPGRPDEPGAGGDDGDLAWGGYPGGLPVTKGAPLFPRRAAETLSERGDVDESSDQTARGSGGSWLRRRGRRAQGDAPRGTPSQPRPTRGERPAPPAPLRVASDRDLDRQPLPPARRPGSAPRPSPGHAPRAVGRMVCVGTDEESSRRAVALAAELSPGRAGPRARRGPSWGAGPRCGRPSGCTRTTPRADSTE